MPIYFKLKVTLFQPATIFVEIEALVKSVPEVRFQIQHEKLTLYRY